jgi:hypothetical protein
MLKRNRLLIGLVGSAVTVGTFCLLPATAQNRNNRDFFQGRGIAQGAAFSRGRNADLSLTLSGENFFLEMTEPQTTSNRNRPLSRIQYRGVIVRRNDEANAPNNFTLVTRIRSFDSSENQRVITNTTGTCRLEVFDARVTYSNCSAIADDSSTRFLGLEQF